MKVDRYKFSSLVILCIIIFSSCSLQKRVYNKGFYTSKNHTIKRAETQDTTKVVTLLSTINQIKKDSYTTLFAQVSKIIKIAKANQTNNNLLIPKTQQVLLIDPCDTIVLKSSTKLLGKVTKITEGKVFFESCDSQGYSSSAILKEDINYIHFANGNKDIREFQRCYTKKKEKNGLAIGGFVLSLLALLFITIFRLNEGIVFFFLSSLILLLCGFILSLISVIQTSSTKEQPKKGSVLGIIGLIFSLAFVVVFFLYFHFF